MLKITGPSLELKSLVPQDWWLLIVESLRLSAERLLKRRGREGGRKRDEVPS
jgi:hypothetical protein